MQCKDAVSDLRQQDTWPVVLRLGDGQFIFAYTTVIQSVLDLNCKGQEEIYSRATIISSGQTNWGDKLIRFGLI